MGKKFRKNKENEFWYMIGMFRVRIEDVIKLGWKNENCGERIKNIIKRKKKREKDVCLKRKKKKGC